MNSESNKIAAIATQESIVHHAKDYLKIREDFADQDEDEGFEAVDDVEDIEDLEDFEYEDEE